MQCKILMTFCFKHKTLIKKFQDYEGIPDSYLHSQGVQVEKCEKHWINTLKCATFLSFPNFMVMCVCVCVCVYIVIYDEFFSFKFFKLWKPQDSKVRAFWTREDLQ